MPGIGETLREARLSRGLTHEYISQIIKIRPEFLEALEAENYSALPGAFYTKNFLRRYADFLGLDSTALVERFTRGEQDAYSQPTEAFPITPPARPPRTGRHLRPNFGILIALLLLAVFGATLAYGAFAPDRDDSTSAAVTATPSSIAVAVVPTSTPTTAPSKPTPTATSEPPRPAATATSMPQPASEPTKRPRRRQTAKATATPRAQAQVEPTDTPRPRRRNTQRATATPQPTATPQATNTPRPTDTPRPANTPKPTRTPHPTPTDAPEPSTADEIVASIRVETSSPVTVRADGRTVYEGILLPGFARSFGADTALYVYSDAAQDVMVSVNGCEARRLDQYGCPGCEEAYYIFPRTYYDCR